MRADSLRHRMVKSKPYRFPRGRRLQADLRPRVQAVFRGSLGYGRLLGWVYNPGQLPYTRATKNPDFRIVRHAVSIDEHRAFFRPTRSAALRRDPGHCRDLVRGSPFRRGRQLPRSRRASSPRSPCGGCSARQSARASPSTPRERRRSSGASALGRPRPGDEEPARVSQGRVVDRGDLAQGRKGRIAAGKWVKRIPVNLARRRSIPPDALFHGSVPQRLAAANIHYPPTNLPPDIRSKFVIPDEKLVHDRCTGPAPARFRL